MNHKFESLVTGRILVDDNHLIEEGYLAIDNGKVAAVGSLVNPPAAVNHLDARGKLVMPGVVDIHVHCYDDLSEGYYHASRAAAAGGTTTIVDHPIDVGGAPVTAEAIEHKKHLVKTESLIDVALLAGVVPASIEKIEDPVRAGIVGYKALMHRTAPEKMRELDDGELLETFRRIAPMDLFVGVHAENDTIIARRIQQLRSQGRIDLAAHNESRPPVSELEAIQRALTLARDAGVRLHIFHVSQPEGIDLVARARNEGVRVTCETCPHYLILSEQDFLRIGPRAKINPPLRPDSREGLWRRLRDGLIDIVASDHAPQDSSRKNKPDIFENSSGTPGVETMLTLLFSEGVVKKRISLARLVQLLCVNPAKLCNLYPRKGCLQVGSDADLVVVDPYQNWMLSGSSLHYAVGWTAFEGMGVTGKPILTMSRGRVVYRDGELVGEKGLAEPVGPSFRVL